MAKNLDNHKGVIVIAVIYVNAVSYLSNGDAMNIFMKYLYSLSSYALPLLFMISAYNYDKSDSNFHNFRSTFFKYNKYLIMTIIINALFFDISFDFNQAFLLSEDAVGFLWFMKTFLIFQLFILANYFFTEGLLIVFVILLLTTTTQKDIGFALYFIYFLFGYSYSRINTHLSDLVPKQLKYVVLLTPFVMNYEYHPIGAYIFITTFFLFNGIIHTKREVKTILGFYGRNSLQSIFFQYFIIELFVLFKLEYSPLIEFVLLLSLTTICVLFYEKISTSLLEKRNLKRKGI